MAIESESLFLGYHALTNEWQDGLLTTMIRKANRVRCADHPIGSLDFVCPAE